MDIGYSATKIVTDTKRGTFPSVVGTPEQSRFSANGNGHNDIMLSVPERGAWQVGQSAVEQSRFVKRREDRGWITGDEYYTLFLAALSEATNANSVEFRLVTGLPAAFIGDKGILRERLLGEHRATRVGRHAQTFKVVECAVIPQAFGALLAACLDDRGRIVDAEMAKGSVGVIDVGSRTVNLLSVNRLSEVARETASVDVGAWDVVRAVRDHLAQECPALELRDHEIVDGIIARQIKYYGEPVDLTRVVRDVTAPMADQIIAQATQLWNGAASLDAILVSGGGALLVGDLIRKHYRHTRIVDDPIYANALGYWRFSQRLWAQGTS